MIKKNLLFVVAGVSLLYACDNPKEKQLMQREAELNRKELLFQAKEAEYLSLLKMRDSLKIQDSIVKINAWPDEIIGHWNSKIVCVETNCSEYVIGDVRNDQWQFTKDSLNLLVNVYNKRDTIRVYKGTYTDSQIALHFATDSTSQKFVDMKVFLNEMSTNKISGYRTVSVNGKCSAKFTVELTKITNQ